jgi:hypothetical protein
MSKTSLACVLPYCTQGAGDDYMRSIEIERDALIQNDTVPNLSIAPINIMFEIPGLSSPCSQTQDSLPTQFLSWIVSSPQTFWPPRLGL